MLTFRLAGAVQTLRELTVEKEEKTTDGAYQFASNSVDQRCDLPRPFGADSPPVQRAWFSMCKGKDDDKHLAM